MVDFGLLKRLCAADGISGDEGAVRRLIVEEIKDFADEIRVDNPGNLLVHKKGRQPARARLMLSAHMDEVGLMVTDITADGYLRFDEVGGIDRRVLLGKQVRVGKNAVCGVVGVKPIHLCRGDEKSAVPEYHDMYIDIGADSREQAAEHVRLGDSVCFDSEFIETETAISGKAIDDRFGCLVMINMIKSDLPYDMDFAFVTQEEIGLRGSAAAAYSLDPDFALILETTTAADIPEIDPCKQVCTLGGGAVVSVMDRRTIYDKEMTALAFKTAEDLGVSAQHKRAVAGGNDAGAIHQSRGGVRVLALSLACRYLHAPACTADKSDCESILTLARAVAEKIAGGCLNDNFGE